MFSALLALCIAFGGGTLQDEVDAWEFNTVVCATTGQPGLTQHVWWRFERHDDVDDYFVAAWRLESNCNTQPVPMRGKWVGTFRDGKDGVWRTIRAKEYWDTISTVDFELLDRQRLPEGKRSGLKQKKP